MIVEASVADPYNLYHFPGSGTVPVSKFGWIRIHIKNWPDPEPYQKLLKPENKLV